MSKKETVESELLQRLKIMTALVIDLQGALFEMDFDPHLDETIKASMDLIEKAEGDE